MAIHTAIKGEPLYDNDLIYRDGHIYITDFRTDELRQLLPAQAKPLEKMLEKTFDTALQGNSVPDQFERTHDDGPVSYGNIIRGEQVGATAKFPDLKSSAPKPTTIRPIFGKKKVLLGTITPTPEGELLVVIHHPKVKMTSAQFFDTTNHLLRGKKPVFMSKNRAVQFDKPFDERLFAVPPKGQQNERQRNRRSQTGRRASFLTVAAVKALYGL